MTIQDNTFDQITSFDAELTAAALKSGTKEVGATSRQFYSVPLEKLKPLPGFNMRLASDKRAAHIENLKKSIMANGFMLDRAIAGYLGYAPGSEVLEVFVRDGHSRLAAALKAKEEGFEITTLPVIFADQDKTMAQMTVASFQSNNAAEPYTTLETALVCQRLRQLEDLEPFQIGERINMTAPYVEDLLMLAAAPSKIRGFVQDGSIAASVAINALKKNKGNAVALITAAVERAQADAKRINAPASSDAVGTKIVAGDSTLDKATDDANKGAGAPAERGQTKPPKEEKAPKEPKEPKKVKKVTLDDINPELKLEKAQKKMASRLHKEVLRMIESKEIPTVSVELDKILYNIEAEGGETPKTR